MSELNLFLGTQIFSGWKSINVTRSIEHVAGQFTLGVTVARGDDPALLTPGPACQLEIDGQRIITGYVDAVERVIDATTHTITLTGRDKTGDLVDCAAMYKGGQWRSATLEKIANDLCAPFGVGVIWEAEGKDAAAPFKVWQIEPSETVFENLARAARHRGIIITSNPDGDLVFTKAGAQSIAVLSLGKEIQRLQTTQSWAERFSLYRIQGDNAAGGLWGETQTAAQTSGIKKDTADGEITRYRPTIILSDDNLTAKTGAARGDWERRRAMAHGQPVTVTLTTWQTPGGDIWQPNRLVTINAPGESLNNAELLIVSVSLTLDESGEHAELQLMPRDGFDEPAQKESKNNGGLWV